MSDHRQANRNRTLLGGKVVLKAGLPTFACHIRDITDRGARLTFEPGDIVPDHFDLEIPRRGAAYKAVVRWREGSSVGVEFIVPPPSGTTDATDRIKELEAENERLKRRIADMARRLDAYGDAERSPL